MVQYEHTDTQPSYCKVFISVISIGISKTVESLHGSSQKEPHGTAAFPLQLQSPGGPPGKL